MSLQKSLLEDVSDFSAGIVAQAAAGWDRRRHYPVETLAQAARLGLVGIQTPVDRGGLGLGFGTKAQVGQILARADFGFAMAILNTHNVAHRLTRDVERSVADRYLDDLLTGKIIGCTALTEPGAGSDFASIATKAEPDGDGWRLEGEKAWIINAAAADLIVVYAQTEPTAGAAGIASFLVDARRDGFERLPPVGMSAQHSIGAGGFRLRGYLVRPGEMVRPPGDAFKSALTDINGARIYVAAMCCGMVEACLKTVADYGASRHTFGVPLTEHQGWRWKLAEAEVALCAASAMVTEACAMIEQGIDARYEAARTKVFATRMAEQRIATLAQLMGAEGLREIHPFSRHQIGARLASFTDGSTEMLLERISGRFRKGHRSKQSEGQRLS